MTKQGEKMLEGYSGGQAHRMGAEEEEAGCKARLSAPCLDSGEGGGEREKKEEKEEPPRKSANSNQLSSLGVQ